MLNLSKWKKKLSAILTFGIIFSFSGGAAVFADIGNSAQQEKYIVALTEENLDFEIDENNVLVKYNGSAQVVDVPNGVTAIGSNAFYKGINGNGITQINLPDSVTTLQDYAFTGSHTITEISLSGNISSIGTGVFSFCKGLVNINVTEANLNFSSDNGVLFNKDKTELISYPEARTAASYVIPGMVKKIWHHAFDNAISLADVSIPEGITEIGKFAFRDCTFSQITLPESLTTLNEGAFARCINLKSVTIPKSVQTWGRNAFFYCLELEQVEFGVGLSSIGESAFSGCAKLTKAVIPESVTAISDSAFTNCSNLTIYGKAGSYSETYANNKQIPFSAVAEPVKVTGVSINQADTEALVGDEIQLTTTVAPENAADQTASWKTSDIQVADVDEKGLVKCLGAGEATITVTTNDGSFTDTVNITVSVPQNGDFTIFDGLLTQYHGTGGKVIIPEGVIRVMDDAFANNGSITSIYFPKSVEYVGNSLDALRGCTGLAKLTFANSTQFLNTDLNDHPGIKELEIYCGGGADTAVEEYHSFTSSDNNTIEKIVIGEGITEIGTYTFSNYHALKEVDLPDSLKKIGQDAFSGCEKLAAVEFPKGLEVIGGYSFKGCSALSEIVIPEGIKEVGGTAFKDCTNLAKVTLPNGLLLGIAFEGCTGLKTVHITLSPYTTTLDSLYADVETILIDDGITLIKGFTANPDSQRYQTKVKEIHFPGSLQTIEGKAFIGCTSLEHITIPGQADVGTDSFYECPNLKSAAIDYHNDPVISNGLSLPDTIETLTIGEGIEEIAGYSFNDQTNLKTLNLPDSLKKIGFDSFNRAGNLENFTFSKSLVEIGDDCFKDSVKLTELSLPSNNIYIGNDAFLNCGQIKALKVFFSGNTEFALRGLSLPVEEIEFAEGITKLADGRLYSELIFTGAAPLKSVSLPESLVEIGSGVFSGCGNLAEVFIPSNVEVIGSSAFENCSKLPSVVIPDKVTSVSGLTFAGCTGLTKLVLPRNTERIDQSAFSGCTNITELSMPWLFAGDIQALRENYDNLEKLTLLNFPNSNNVVRSIALDADEKIVEDGFTAIERFSFGNSPKTKILELPQSITSIEDGSFDTFTHEDFALKVYRNSYAHNYAVEHNIPFVLMGENTAVTGINIISESEVVLLGAEELLLHAVLPATASNKNVTWTSSNTEIAAVSEFGHVKGLKEGKVTITATTEGGGFTDTCEVTVVKVKRTYEEDLTYMALSAMVYYDFLPSDAGKTLAEIIGENADKDVFKSYFLKNITAGEFITAVAGDWKLLTGYDMNDISGYYGAAFINDATGEIVVASRGTEPEKGFVDNGEDILFGAYGVPGSQFQSSNSFYRLVKNQYPEAQITTTGHSLGGALATYLAQRNGLKARVFNAPSATYSTYTNYIRDLSTVFHGMDRWDIVDYVNEHDTIGNCGIGDNYSYASGQFGHFFTASLSGKTVYDFMNEGNIIATGGAIDETIIANDNAQVNLLEGSWNTHAMGSLVKGLRDGDEFIFEIDRKDYPNQTIPYKAEEALSTSLTQITLFDTIERLLLGSKEDDVLNTNWVNLPIVAFGGDGSDIIVAGINEDMLVGGAGRNYLDGGAGSDCYYFSKENIDGDIIHDPSGTSDTIYLTDLALADISIGTDTIGENSYFTITETGGKTIYVDKKRAFTASKFRIVDKNNQLLLLTEPSQKRMMSLASMAPQAVQAPISVVTPIRIDGSATVEIFDMNNQLIKEFSNQETAQEYESYGYFYGFTGENPYTMIYLFNDDYKISVKSEDKIDYAVYSLTEDDTAIMEIAASDVDLSGGKTLVTQTVTKGEVPQLEVVGDNQEGTALTPNVAGINKDMSLNKNQLTLEVGKQETLTIAEKIEDSISWSSSVPQVAEVDENGMVTAKAVGSALITAATENGEKTARCFVTVTAAPEENPGIPSHSHNHKDSEDEMLPDQVSEGVTGSKLTSLAYTPDEDNDTDLLVAGIINDDGTVTFIPSSHYANGKVSWKGGVDGKAAVFYNDVHFTDTEGMWFNDAAKYMAARGVVNGIGAGRFAPRNNISRADITLMLIRAFGGDTEGTGTFSDVDENVYYAKALSVAKDLGIAAGAEGRFNPGASVTRQDMFVLFARTLKVFGLLDENADVSDVTFADEDAIAGYAKDYIKLLAANGYIKGADGKINPLGTATRGETAQMLANFFKAH